MSGAGRPWRGRSASIREHDPLEAAREPAVRLEQPLARSVQPQWLDPPGAHRDTRLRLRRRASRAPAQSTSATASSSRNATTSCRASTNARLRAKSRPGTGSRHVAHRGEPGRHERADRPVAGSVVHHQDLGRRHGLAQQRIERALKEEVGRSRVHTAALRRMAVIPSAAGRAGPPRPGGSSGCPRPPGRRSRPAARRAPRGA